MIWLIFSSSICCCYIGILTDFCLLTLYLAVLSNSLINSNKLSTDSFGLSTYQSCHLKTMSVSFLLFQFLPPFLSYTYDFLSYTSCFHNWVSLGKLKSLKTSVFFILRIVLLFYTMKIRATPDVIPSGHDISSCGSADWQWSIWRLVQKQS